MKPLGWRLRPTLAVIRAAAARVALVALIAASVGLLVLSKADVKLANRVATVAGDAAVPLLALADRPLSFVRAEVEALGAHLAVYAENRRLREENRRLLAWQVEAARLGVQNGALREMLEMAPVDRAPLATTARVVGDSGGSFVQTVLIDAGAQQGVRAGMAAATPQGLAGRIVQAGRYSARILLITDLSSQIPVLVERSRDRAILAGDNSPLPTLRFLPATPDIRVGDRIMTSGDGGMLPPGLLVGQVAAAGDGGVTVRPFVDWAHLDYVNLLRYDATAEPRGAVPQPGPSS